MVRKNLVNLAVVSTLFGYRYTSFSLSQGSPKALPCISAETTVSLKLRGLARCLVRRYLACNTLIECIQIVDVFFCFHTAYYNDNRVLVMDPTKVTLRFCLLS